MSGSPFGILEFMGSKKSSEAAASSANRATDVQMEMFRESQAATAPWRRQGRWALNRLRKEIKEGPGPFRKSPSYRVAFDEGMTGIQRAASAMGGLRSGAHLQAATRYAKDMASTEYDNFLRRWYQSLTPFQSLAGLGITAGTQMGQNALYTGRGVADSTMAAGQAEAAGYLGMTNGLSRSFGNVGQNVFDYVSQNQLRNLGGGGGYGWNAGAGYMNSPTYGPMTGAEMNSMMWL